MGELSSPLLLTYNSHNFLQHWVQSHNNYSGLSLPIHQSKLQLVIQPFQFIFLLISVQGQSGSSWLSNQWYLWVEFHSCISLNSFSPIYCPSFFFIVACLMCICLSLPLNSIWITELSTIPLINRQPLHTFGATSASKSNVPPQLFSWCLSETGAYPPLCPRSNV